MIAANAAISSPLLEDASVKGARGVIINVTGGNDLSLMEVSEASAVIQEAAHEEANIIFGAVVDPRMDGQVKITVIATGFDRGPVAQRDVTASAAQTPVDLHSYAAWKQESTEKIAAGRRRLADVAEPQSPSAAGSSAPGGERIRHAATPSRAGTSKPSSPLDVPAFLRRQSE